MDYDKIFDIKCECLQCVCRNIELEIHQGYFITIAKKLNEHRSSAHSLLTGSASVNDYYFCNLPNIIEIYLMRNGLSLIILCVP